MFKYGGFQNKTKWLMTYFVQGARPHGNIAVKKKKKSERSNSCQDYFALL